MSKKIFIDAMRTIKKTISKFITLFAIVTLGVSFFVGVSASPQIMSNSVDLYNDQNNLMDIQIFSIYGFDNEDIKVLENIEGIEEVQGKKFVDVLLKVGSNESVTRVVGYEENLGGINQFKLIQGRLPQNETECLIGKVGDFNFVKIGDEVQLSRPNDDLDDILGRNSFKVVGIVETPEYINHSLGNSTLNNRQIYQLIYLPEDVFEVDFYSMAVATVENASLENSFGKNYFDVINLVKKRVEEVALTQQHVRRNLLVQEAQENYDEGLKEYEDGKAKYEDEITDAEQKINEGEKQIKKAIQDIAAGKEELAEAKTKFKDFVQDAESQLNIGQEKVDVAIKQWESGKKEFEENTKPELLAKKLVLEDRLGGLKEAQDALRLVQVGKEELLLQKQQVDGRIEQLQSQSSLTIEEKEELQQLLLKQATLNEMIADADMKIEMIWINLSSSGITDEASLLDAISQIEKGIIEINTGISQAEAEINNAKLILDKTTDEIELKRNQLSWEVILANEKFEESEKIIRDSEVQVATAKKEIKTGKEELSAAKLEGQAELDKGWADLMEAKEEISKLEEGKWIILDRNEHYSSKTYRDTVDQMGAIAKIFPVFFFLVAALVCSTTMTRMIDEQRGQIGALRALGYHKIACSMKYILYAGISTLAGGIIGSIIGMRIFPVTIYSTWGMMYQLPPMQYQTPWALIVGANGMFLLVMLGVTMMATRKEMKEVPSQLLRPKAPAVGKTILLERISLIWNKLSFTSKVTARNLFRYKKRFFMTVLGIAGCTALLVAGFGIRSSISLIVDKEFSEMQHYDGFISFKNNLSYSEVEKMEEEILNLEGVDKVERISIYASSVESMDGEKISVSTSVFEGNEAMHEIRATRERKTKKVLALTDDSIMINEKLAEVLNVREGDTVIFESENNISREVMIGGVFESYVGHNVFLTSKYYQDIFEEKLAANAIAVKINETLSQTELVGIKGVDSLQLYAPIIKTFNEMIEGLDIVVYILILSAGLLVLIVLSNLTSVNISERQREIATLKVLGFNRKEINHYIYKENILLTIIGILFGLVLGTVLHQYIILLVEVENAMFVRELPISTYVYASLITLAFSMIVNYVMAFSLRKIKMVESLKSVE